MHLDPPTLLIVNSTVTLLAGTLFLTSWRQAPEERTLAYWGGAHLVGAVGTAGLALRGQIPDAISIVLSNAVILCAYGLIWSGVRSFERRRPRVGLAMVGALVWCALCLIPTFYGSVTLRIVYASAVTMIYCGAATAEIWHGRAERLASRLTAAAVLGLHGAFYGVRIPLTLLAPPQIAPNPLASPWVAILCFATILFSIAAAFTFMALVKERAEREQRIAASTDALTGVRNRRAFVDAAGRALVKHADGALLLFDLDRFKAVNDVHGHAVGDAVLVGFCAMAASLLPRDALLGRLGGEEFACFLPEVSPAEALGRAEELRRTFAQLNVPELPDLRVSVSIGIAQTHHGIAFDTLMRRADAALYAAKNNGRDRVAVAGATARAA
ncbi:diguanylate cyclase (GGDEF) domain-containing protein [Methylobacterium phyllostachyos]|uniref:diguanylate cyclase n=1 Tax=Methylobacterium phyllostachyos TaxID=582672 RepID=A0A1G9R2Q6_9HYPH|nr:GGDEF domain-containing protein [Methylobacterium phyllostachyos]SDM17582.1 diguanylate cyclase (GGDEF) domain-containing protein [Methylobacterium phyllostachyos]